jgi:hypothetical protein
MLPDLAQVIIAATLFTAPVVGILILVVRNL